MVYQLENGKPAPDLAALAPKMLPTLPMDPFGEGPFQYRVSPGELIVWRRRPDQSEYRKIAAGEGILWSVGADLEDDGGRVNDPVTWRYRDWQPGGDIIFLVPVVRRR